MKFKPMVFTQETAIKPYQCSECFRKISSGQTVWVSRRGNIVKKKVCSKDCWMEFDDRFWTKD